METTISLFSNAPVVLTGLVQIGLRKTAGISSVKEVEDYFKYVDLKLKYLATQKTVKNKIS